MEHLTNIESLLIGLTGGALMSRFLKVAAFFFGFVTSIIMVTSHLNEMRISSPKLFRVILFLIFISIMGLITLVFQLNLESQ